MWIDFFVVLAIVACVILGPLFSWRAYKQLTENQKELEK